MASRKVETRLVIKPALGRSLAGTADYPPQAIPNYVDLTTAGRAVDTLADHPPIEALPPKDEAAIA
ncbi:MAG TPA: hypothetical protein VES69_12915 [Pyrinomonadaceae bacterium]|nr:hypothetical protein [Pyrinomonadaceae bacterium]